MSGDRAAGLGAQFPTELTVPPTHAVGEVDWRMYTCRFSKETPVVAVMVTEIVGVAPSVRVNTQLPRFELPAPPTRQMSVSVGFVFPSTVLRRSTVTVPLAAAAGEARRTVMKPAPARLAPPALSSLRRDQSEVATTPAARSSSIAGMSRAGTSAWSTPCRARTSASAGSPETWCTRAPARSRTMNALSTSSTRTSLCITNCMLLLHVDR